MIHSSRLRIYCGPEDECNSATVLSTDNQKTHEVRVPAGEIISALADAADSGRAWLDDFRDDEITISSDLYEVILAYQHFRRPSA